MNPKQFLENHNVVSSLSGGYVHRRIIRPRKDVVGGGGYPPPYVAGLREILEYKV